MSEFDAEYEPSPWEPIALEVDRYERSGGTEPSDLVGDQWIILWTLGAKSGKVRKTPLVRVADGSGRYAVIGSMGGAPQDPQWVHNVRARPVARLQDGGSVRDYAAREVEGDEKAAWWARATQVWPDYDTYQAATERVIPVFVLEPTGTSSGAGERSAPDLTFVLLIHQALRADGVRLAATVAALEPEDRTGRLAGVREYFRRYREQLVAHHTHEDELYFPALAARVGAERMHLQELTAQHEQLDPLLDRIDAGLAGLAEGEGEFSVQRTAVAGDLATVVDHLHRHLDLEESTALALVESEMPVAEYDVLEKRVRAATTRAQSRFLIPWLAEHASPEQRRAWFRSAPPLRVVYLLTRRGYRRLDRALDPLGP